MDRRHDRPYRCQYPGCSHQRGFGSKGELTRHINSVHKRTKISCPVEGCSYACPRKDNLQDHIVRQHKDIVPEHSLALNTIRGSPSIGQDAFSSELLGQENNPANEVTMNVHNANEQGHEPEVQDPASGDIRELQEENRRLKSEMEALKKELESSKEKEQTLFKIIKTYTG